MRQMLGSVDRGHVFRLIEALAQGDGKTVVETSEALRRTACRAASTLEEMTHGAAAHGGAAGGARRAPSAATQPTRTRPRSRGWRR